MTDQTLAALLPGPVVPATDRSALSGDSRSAAAADFDSFLTLLTAQLRNQDPLSPLDSTEFIAQLASFSTVEQVVGTNERLDAFIEQSFSADLASFASWIGRDVVLSDGTFFADGTPKSFDVPPNVNADRIEAIVRASDGRTLRQFVVEPDANGRATWDGLSQAGAQVAGTEVAISLSYVEGGSVLEEIPAQIPRTVSGIRGTEEGLFLELTDGGRANPEQVTRLTTLANTAE
ncbi:MAG: flagellar hook capping FlgD N-terminal domain-containing protein [Pseudomonadota bacterium]